MSYATYKILHFLGIFTLITVLAASAAHALRGGLRTEQPWRRTTGVAHGLAAVLILVGGFGMLARLGDMYGNLPAWVLAKLVIWGALAASLAVPYFGPGYARLLLVALPLLTMTAGAIALFKPF